MKKYFTIERQVCSLYMKNAHMQNSIEISTSVIYTYKYVGLLRESHFFSQIKGGSYLLK